ncbi:hypothetical protein HYV74_03710 [Candidatus Uhrbacteria bacterium]|nr:hypothetical protein [Candidatus Uhrbacteria bacterium]
MARVMYGYAGMKAAELAARRGMAMVGGERYAGLRHGTADEFRSAIDSGAGDPKLLARIHQQLLDPEFRNSASLSEQAAVQDAARRLENQIARGGLDAVSQHSDALEDAVVTREKRDRERKAIIGGARIAGLILGATLGPVIIEAIRPQPHPETDPLQKHNPHFENTRFVARADADLFRMAQIKEGDGLTQVLQRQLEHAPDVYGFKGAPEDVHRWALAEAKRIATENGYLTADGRTTATGLRFFGEGNSGGVLLHPSGQLEKIGPVEDYDTWLEHAKGRTPGGGLDALDREFQELSVEQTKQAVEKGITEVDAEVGKIMERIGGRHAGEAISPLSAEERSLYALQLKALFGKMHILEKELGGVAGPQTGGNLDQQKLYAHLEGTRGDLAQLQDELALEHGVSLDAPDAEAVALGDPSVRGGGGNLVTESGAGSVEPRGPSAPTSGDRLPAGWADDMRGTGAGKGLRGSSDPFAAAEAEASGGNAAWKGLVGAVEKGTGGVLRGSDMAGVFRLGETGARVSMHALEQLRSASLKDVLTSTDGSLGDMKQELLNRLAAAHPDWKVPGGAVTTDSLLKGLGGDANVKALDYLKNHHELLGRSPEA